MRSGQAGRGTGGDAADVENAVAAAADTLRELGRQFDQWTADPATPGAAGPARSDLHADFAAEEHEALLVSLGIEAIIDTNAMVGQRSLHEFLR